MPYELPFAAKDATVEEALLAHVALQNVLVKLVAATLGNYLRKGSEPDYEYFTPVRSAHAVPAKQERFNL